MPWTDTEILAFSDFETFKGRVVTTTKLLAEPSEAEVQVSPLPDLGKNRSKTFFSYKLSRINTYLLLKF